MASELLADHFLSAPLKSNHHLITQGHGVVSDDTTNRATLAQSLLAWRIAICKMTAPTIMSEVRKLSELTRQQLYDLVWSRPATKLATEFGIRAGA